MNKIQHETKQNNTTYRVGRFVIQYCPILHRRSSSETSSIHISEGKRSASSSEDPVIQKALSLASNQSNCSTPSSSNSQTPVRYVSLSEIMAKSSSLNPMRKRNNNNTNQTSTSLTSAELSHYSQIPECSRSKSVCFFENKSSNPQPVYNPDLFSTRRVESVPEENEPPQIINSINENEQQQQQHVFEADELLIQQQPTASFDNNNNNNSTLEPPVLPQPAAVEKEPLLINPNPIVLEEIPIIQSPDNIVIQQQQQQQQQQPKSFDTSAFFSEPDMVIENRSEQSKSMVSPEYFYSNNMDEQSPPLVMQPIQPIQAPIQMSSFINEQTYAPPTPPPTPPLDPITIVGEEISTPEQQLPQHEEHFLPTPPPPADVIEHELLLVQQQQQQQQQQLHNQQIEINTVDNHTITNRRVEILQRTSSNHSTDSVDSPFLSSVKELGTPCASPYQIWDDLPKGRQIELLNELIDTVNTDGKIYDLMFPQTNQDCKKRTRHSLLNELEQLTKKNELLQNQYNQLKNLQNKNVSI